MSGLAPIARAVEDIRRGRLIILVDDEDRENEGDFVCAASACTPEAVNTMMVHGRGLICTPVTRECAGRLHLPPQVRRNTAALSTAFTVSVDAARGIGTGISAHDRCHSILTLCAAKSRPADLVRPGHIFPLEAREGGVLVRPGHTEAAVDLARLAGLPPAGVICEIMSGDGRAARLPELRRLARRLGLRIYAIRDLVTHRLAKEPLLRRQTTVRLPTDHGEFGLHVYHAPFLAEDGAFLALTFGKDRFTGRDLPLVRVHAEGSIASLLSRLGRPGRSALDEAMARIARHGSGALVYLRHSPFHDAPPPLFGAGAMPADIWEEGGDLKCLGRAGPDVGCGLGAQILRDLGVRRMRLLGGAGVPCQDLGLYGLEVVERLEFPEKGGRA